MSQMDVIFRKVLEKPIMKMLDIVLVVPKVSLLVGKIGRNCFRATFQRCV